MLQIEIRISLFHNERVRIPELVNRWVNGGKDDRKSIHK